LLRNSSLLESIRMAGTDDELLQEYASGRNPAAFAELARRHADWVYSTAARMMRDSHLAQDVTQAVFLLLSQQPQKAVGRKLPGWLFQVTRFTAANTLRSETRRRRLEQNAAIMAQSEMQPQGDALWQQLSPLLDELMSRLGQKDRQALLLRFYQGKSYSQVGEYLGISEDAARKRVDYAVERLRMMFGARGVFAQGGASLGSAALGASLLANATHPAPPGLMTAFVTGGAYSASASALAGSIQRTFMIGHIKVAAAVLLVAAISLTAVGSIYYLLGQTGAPTANAAASSGPTPSARASSAGRTTVDVAGFPTASASNSPPTIDPQTLKYQTNFQLGSTKLLNGDQITITSVRGSSDVMAPGNSYLVTGTYTLASQSDAMLSLYTTSTRAGLNDNGPYGNNFTPMHKGSGTFTLEFHFRIDGYPHLSIYPATGGEVLGSQYFGSGRYVFKQPL
jgi:RNA polymerase sigma factor (sigma-70 family)